MILVGHLSIFTGFLSCVLLLSQALHTVKYRYINFMSLHGYSFTVGLVFIA